MSRGLTDPAPEDSTNSEDAQAELDQVISNLIMAQNRLHDRLVVLERELDHLKASTPEHEAADRKRWKRGI